MLRSLKRLAKSIPGVERAYRRLNAPPPGSLGLTTMAEREYFARVAADEYQGRGAVIDLGSWLGSTTAALAQGLLRNPRPEAQSAIIHTYDLFVWDCDYDSFAPGGFRFDHGESFLPVFQTNVRPWLEQIQVHVGDLTAVRWDGPVELILNDASKTWPVVEAVWRQFVSQLLVGGLLIEQDFKHYYCPWLHLLHYRFRDHFELAEDVLGGCTTAFRLLKPVEAAALDGAFGWDAYPTDERRAAIDWASALVPSEWRPAIHAAEAMWYIHQGNAVEGGAVLDRIGAIEAPFADVALARAALGRIATR